MRFWAVNLLLTEHVRPADPSLKMLKSTLASFPVSILGQFALILAGDIYSLWSVTPWWAGVRPDRTWGQTSIPKRNHSLPEPENFQENLLAKRNYSIFFWHHWWVCYASIFSFFFFLPATNLRFCAKFSASSSKPHHHHGCVCDDPKALNGPPFFDGEVIAVGIWTWLQLELFSVNEKERRTLHGIQLLLSRNSPLFSVFRAFCQAIKVSRNNIFFYLSK